MSAFNDPRYLAASGAIKGLPTPIDSDRPCPGCGYNLRGLEVGGVCPECGRAIAFAVKKGESDTLIDAPREYLVRFAAALTFASIGIVVNILALFTVVSVVAINGVLGFYGLGGRTTIWGVNWQIPTPSNTLTGAVFLVGALLGLGGLVVATLPRPAPADAPSRKQEWKRLRLTAWILEAGWPLCAMIVLALVLLTPAPPAMAATGAPPPIPFWVGAGAIAAALAALGGVLGLLFAGVLLARFADWIPDPELGWRMRTAVWSIGVFGGLILLTGVTPPSMPSFTGVIPFLLWLGVGVFWLIFLGGIAVLFASIVQMAKTAWDAVGNHRQREERDRRMLERMRKEREAQEQRALRVPHQEEPAPGVRKIGVAPRPAGTRPPQG